MSVYISIYLYTYIYVYISIYLYTNLNIYISIRHGGTRLVRQHSLYLVHVQGSQPVEEERKKEVTAYRYLKEGTV